MKRKRCPWPMNDPVMTEYHDREWGVPLHDDKVLFEFLILESFQAGLSWRTVLHKRENFRRAFAGFEVEKVARFGKKDVARLLKDKGIIRNRLKIEGAINNAKCFLQIQQEFGSFNKYVWRFVDFKPILHKFRKLSDLPARTALSDAMSEDMGRRGFKFRGSTICYAFMQAVGMVNDHLVSCYRYKDMC